MFREDKECLLLIPLSTYWALCGSNAYFLVHYLLIGLYMGVVAIGFFLEFDLSSNYHTPLPIHSPVTGANALHVRAPWQSSTIGEKCSFFNTNHCEYFQAGKVKVVTITLSVLASYPIHSYKVTE